MAVAAVAFMLLAIFYYEYVPEGAYDEGPVLEIISDFCWRTFSPGTPYNLGYLFSNRPRSF